MHLGTIQRNPVPSGPQRSPVAVFKDYQPTFRDHMTQKLASLGRPTIHDWEETGDKQQALASRHTYQTVLDE